MVFGFLTFALNTVNIQIKVKNIIDIQQMY